MKGVVKGRGAVVVLLMVGVAYAWGWRVGGPWYDLRLRVKVVDDDGRAVEGAEVEVGFDQGGDRGLGFEGLTDSNGEFRVRGRCYRGDLGVEVTKEGYYGWWRGMHFYRKGEKRDGEWGPYDPWVHGVTAILKRVEHPIRMYEKKVRVDVPGFERWYGYDLEVGDWVEPYGRGKVGDFVMWVWREVGQNVWTDHKVEFRLRFSNVGDGIQRGEEEYSAAWEGSAFVGMKHAPEGGYETGLVIRWELRNNEWYGDWKMDDRHIWYFRVRTELDETGGVKRALYGKLRGGISVGGVGASNMWVQFHYYLNPNWNDRGLECGWNLFGKEDKGK